MERESGQVMGRMLLIHAGLVDMGREDDEEEEEASDEYSNSRDFFSRPALFGFFCVFCGFLLPMILIFPREPTSFFFFMCFALFCLFFAQLEYLAS